MSQAEVCEGDRRLFCVGINATVQHPVTPGDRLHIETRLIRCLGQLVNVKDVVKTEERVVASGDFNLAVIPEEANRCSNARRGSRCS
ncbi:hypothetical protein NKDENANG_03614 [Candidatus Entotheonellaceae bacterium PAL068K]